MGKTDLVKQVKARGTTREADDQPTLITSRWPPAQAREAVVSERKRKYLSLARVGEGVVYDVGGVMFCGGQRRRGKIGCQGSLNRVSSWSRSFRR